LALGCNIFNLGFFPCFIAYPLYRKIIGKEKTGIKSGIASLFHRNGEISAIAALVAAVVSLQLGAFSVVVQTYLSGISELPFMPFLLLMQPIHLAIGIVEGVVTAAVVAFVAQARPEIILAAQGRIMAPAEKTKKIRMAFISAAVVTAAVLSWFASSRPDGLEWAMFNVSGKEELEAKSPLHAFLAELQGKSAFLPDYGFKKSGHASAAEAGEAPSWPAVDAGTSAAGIIGGGLTMQVVFFSAWLARRRQAAA
ncbi:MAG: energy-coupling factor ABC transporter permease, partial [Candidatus Omnitrophica bacterium]|nr:energy-coupling factor ABC transporter permease [Candidatus Omnitrophota bacterium]